ncbi:AAA family ATPase [Gordonia tangerina]|uniref:MoxR family ATPase n=1 Tax=Gordonia tangerina TaxID=2911060 RepID=A0ABS9DM88_9ACTN|nr:MoxR family ATPase [Gordonia tangerina]MCF3940345.1 MoxR family ATPase [Gordonia tangerina]
MTSPLFSSADDVARHLDAVDYLADEGLATALFLATSLQMPILLEGEPGVGKTSAATALATALDTDLIRLQCYEGLAAHDALYEWNYQRQLLAIKMAESRGQDFSDADLYAPEFLSERPLLAAIRHRGARPPVLLIDEIDRADDEFEALLFEFLGEGAVTVPELGTIRAQRRPLVVLTSNRSRELHEALRRRCLYHWIVYPGAAQVVAILRRTVSGASAPLLEDASVFVGRVRELDLDKPPGIAEAIDWVSALITLGVTELVATTVAPTLGTLVKTPDDHETLLAALEHGSVL